MIKVAIVCPREPWSPSGQERVVANTAICLKDYFDIEIYCTGDRTYDKEWDGILVHIFKSYSKSYRYSPQMNKALKDIDYDIIHAHGFTSYGSYATANNKKNKPFIFNPHFHELGSTSAYKVMRVIYDPIIGKYLLKKANNIICVSEYERLAIQNKFKIDTKKIVIIPNGVDIETIQNSKPFEFDGKLILYVGRLEKYKNIQLVIQTMKFLPNDYRLYIIGQGPYKPTLEQLINKLDLKKRVKIFTNINDNDLYRWMKTCSIFITLSEIEAFGITVIEALASGKPVIVNNKGGLAELAKRFKTSIIVLNIEDLSLKRLGNEIIKNTNIEIKENLDDYKWQNIARQLKRVYLNIIK